MNIIYSYEIRTSEPKLNGDRKRIKATDPKDAKDKIMKSFASDENRVGRKLRPDARLINLIKMDGTRLTGHSEPQESHQGYCPIINDEIRGTYVHFETAKAAGGMIVPRKIAVKMYGFATGQC